MKTTQKRIVRIYTPLSWSSSVDMLGTQLTQVFKEDEGGEVAYMPNRRITPTVILPVIRVHDSNGIFRQGTANDLLADMHWYDGDAELVEGADYKIEKGANQRRGMLTIYRNTPCGSSQNLRFSAMIADTRRGENLKVGCSGITLSTTEVATDKYMVTADIPSSYFYNPITAPDLLTVLASSFRGKRGEAVLDYELHKFVSGTESSVKGTDYEVVSFSSGSAVFNQKLIQSNQYAIVGKLAGREVGRYAFSITRKYPEWEARQRGASDMEVGQLTVSDSVTVSAGAPMGLVDFPERFFSIQPHTVTRKNGDMNWGERSVLNIPAVETGFEDGGSVGIYFNVDQLPCNKVALSENGNALAGENNKLLII